MLRKRLLTLVAFTLLGAQAVLTCNLGFCTTLGTLDKELLAAIETYNKRQYRQAFSSFAALAQKKPADATVQYYLGLCYYQLGDRTRARKHFEWIFESPADSSIKSRAAAALNQMLGVKPPPPESHAPTLGLGRGTDSNGVIIGCDVGQGHPGQGKLRLTGYGVYIPKNYTGSEKLPWILALSPSGSAGDWDELLSDACDKHHWAYAASQNSKDSIAWPEVEPHLRDTVDSALKKFPLDPNGLCVVGFSGGGTRALQIAALWPNVRKVIVDGGCISKEFLTPSKYPTGKSAVFLAGSLDPNVAIMKQNERFLIQQGWKTKWIEFQGGHQFAPASAYEQAIEWLSRN